MPSPPSAAPTARPDQVGVVPFRRVGPSLEVLLVTSRTRKRWICPKGSRMEGLTDRQTAAVEAQEEAGAEGYVYPRPLGTYAHESHTGIQPVTLYPMEVLLVRSVWAEKRQRRRAWFPLDEAVRRVDPRLGAVLSRLPFALVQPDA